MLNMIDWLVDGGIFYCYGENYEEIDAWAKARGVLVIYRPWLADSEFEVIRRTMNDDPMGLFIKSLSARFYPWDKLMAVKKKKDYLTYAR